MKKHLPLHLLFFAGLILFTTTLHAQKMSFKIIQADTWKAIDHVEIKSSSHGTLYSDVNGHFELQYDDHDTLMLSKDFFHTILYVIEAKNFDTAHTISLTMTPSTNEQRQKDPAADISNLQKFDYHFIHDNPANDSYMKIHAMESLPANKTRTGYQKEFKIGTVPFDHTTIEHKSSGKSAYSLK